MARSKNREAQRGVRRSGWIMKGALFAVGAVTVSGLLFLTSFLPKFSWGGTGEKPLTYQVVRGEFVSEVLERGDVESASNVEIRCEVESQGTGVMILRIVPEGTYVQPGDFLVELDSSSLRDRWTQQQITVANARADLIQAQNVLDTALIAKQEYLEGQYRQELLAIQIENFVAQENQRRAEDYLKYSQSLAQKGYITQAQLEADRFALERAQKDVESARTKLDVLERFTKPKMLKQLDADIQTAQAKLEAQQYALSLEEQELKEIEDQIAKCTITAPEAGQVVYANQVGVRGQTDVIIQEGVRVRERQTIIRLPDPKRMRVKAKVNESKIGLVSVGLPAWVQVDALAGQVFDGEVVDVAEYPLPTSFFNSNVKDYEVIVRIDNPTEQLRAGLTAQVRIVSHREPDVLQVPVQAVFEHMRKFYCIVWQDGTMKPVEVELGPSNEKFVIVRKGLEEKQEVVLNAAAHREQVGMAEEKLTVQASSSGEPVLSGGNKPDGGGAAGPAGEPQAARGSGRPAGTETAPAGPGMGPPRGSGEPGAGGPPGAGMGPPGAGMGAPGGLDPAMIVDRIFDRTDADKNGKIDAAEIPEDRKEQMLQNDADGDGAISKEEMR
ncbi:MAG: HlyD family efflux transporter periplasmic adaptor subunit, partial [Thermogutta sp.]|nr:HlyD family efflux transporter periplasmic adaptor subunit [Thermogutta sp.]